MIIQRFPPFRDHRHPILPPAEDHDDGLGAGGVLHVPGPGDLEVVLEGPGLARGHLPDRRHHPLNAAPGAHRVTPPGGPPLLLLVCGVRLHGLGDSGWGSVELQRQAVDEAPDVVLQRPEAGSELGLESVLELLGLGVDVREQVGQQASGREAVLESLQLPGDRLLDGGGLETQGPPEVRPEGVQVVQGDPRCGTAA